MDDNAAIAHVYLRIHCNGKNAPGTPGGTGKSCAIEELTKTTRKDQDSLLQLVQGCDRFSVWPAGATHRVSIARLLRLEHPLQVHSMKTMLTLLSKLVPPEPTHKKELKKEFQKHFRNDSYRFEIVLAGIMHYLYAGMDSQGLMSWNSERVSDLRKKLSQSTIEQPILKHSTGGSSQQQTPFVDVSGSDEWRLDDGTKVVYVKNPEKLASVMQSDPILRGQSCTKFVALDCEGVPESLELVQIAYSKFVYVFDGRQLGARILCQELMKLLTSESTTKVVHDIHQDALALSRLGNITLNGVLDSQLLSEYCFGSFNEGFNGFLKEMECPVHPSKDFIKSGMSKNPSFWETRPLPKTQIEYAAMDVYCLSKAFGKIDNILSPDQLSLLKDASLARARSSIRNEGVRHICFDPTKGHSMVSEELMRLTKPTVGIFGSVPEVESEVKAVVDLLPPAFRERLVEQNRNNAIDEFRGILGVQSPPVKRELLDIKGVSDFALDVGREPECWIRGKREYLCEQRGTLVEEKDIRQVVNSVGEPGHDNRAGLNGTLHRFSVIRARDDSITGLTIRIGRNITGIADLLCDYILGTNKSILLLGEPGSGKTTIVREITRLIAKEDHVLVVDTSNEIGGDGIQPHKCIGCARRMMVKSLDEQSKVMIECVQNHTPTCMVIDEIGRPREVEAARTVRHRGVRIVASAHGDLRKLIKNKELRGLVGGVETVTLGDEAAKEEAKRRSHMRTDVSNENSGAFGINKTKAQRANDPTFDLVVELQRGRFHEWQIVNNVAGAVDAILDGRQYKAQLRSRDPATGDMFLKYTYA